MTQTALFFWFTTNSGAMWVHYGTYKDANIAKKHEKMMKARNSDLKSHLVELPSLDAKSAVEASRV